MGAAIGVVVGLFVALVLPRWPRAVLVLAAVVLGIVAVPVLFGLGWPAIAAAPAIGGALALLALSVRRFPRLLVLLLCLAGVAFPLASVANRLGGPVAGGIAALGGLIAALVGTARREAGLRLALAGIGATVALVSATALAHRWALLPALAILFWLSSRLAPRWPEPAPGTRPAGLTLPAAILVAASAAVLALPWLAADLKVPSDLPYSARAARLAASAPGGGVVWPIPSEAIFWGPAAKDFPAFENLDARWLAGTDPGGLARVPGTSFLWGRPFLRPTVSPLRERHDVAEIALLRQAAAATVRAVREALPLYRSGAKEADVAAAIRKSYLGHGCDADSFPGIVASGKSAGEVHGEDNRGTLGAGELVVTDVGCYAQHHAADFTRTLPVGGKFSPEQRRLYEAVRAAQQAAAKACRPGVGLFREFEGHESLDAVSRAALKERGVESDYPHPLGHTVGLFVHDVGGVMEPLAPGMLITLEPGLYRRGSLGIRIEDEYLVTDTGCELVTEGLSSDPDELERLLAPASASPPPAP